MATEEVNMDLDGDFEDEEDVFSNNERGSTFQTPQDSSTSRQLNVSAANNCSEASTPNQQRQEEQNLVFSGYHEEGRSFGIMKKGKYKAASDFNFKFVAEVICDDPHSSGFIVELEPDRPHNAVESSESSTGRRCYFTSESTNRKTDFMKEISSSYKVACLQCSFSDKELSEFIQFKKRQSQPIPIKYAVSHVGRHSDGTWVLGNNAYFDSDGTPITIEDSKYVWIGDIYQGNGVAKEIDQCSITRPFSTDCLKSMLHLLKRTLQHNFFPAVMTIAGTIMALHYTKFMETMRSCPITLAYGSSGTGKTTALHCGLAVMGANDIRFYREVTPAMVQKLCSETNIPLGMDDPDSKASFSKVLMDVHGGAKKGTISRGETRPISTVVISANFPTVEQQKYASRCMFIEFSNPPVSLSLNDYMSLVEIWKKAGSCAAFCIHLGHTFFSEGITQVDDEITPLLLDSIEENTLSPRVLPAYSILYWFALKILEECGMPFVDDLLQYFRDTLLMTAARLQSWIDEKTTEMDSNHPNRDSATCDNFGNELLECIAGMPSDQVGCFLKRGSYQTLPVICIKLDRVPGLSLEAKATMRRWLLKNKSKGAHNVPRRFSDSKKNVKCTVISEEAFSDKILAEITAAIAGQHDEQPQPNNFSPSNPPSVKQPTIDTLPRNTMVKETTEITQPPISTMVKETTEITQPSNITMLEETMEITQPPNSTMVKETTEITQPSNSTTVKETTKITQQPNLSTTVKETTKITQPSNSTMTTEITQPPKSTMVKETTEITQPSNTTTVKETITQPSNSTMVKETTETTQPPNSTMVKETTEITQPPNSTITTEITQPPNSTMQVKDTTEITQPPISTVTTEITQPPNSTMQVKDTTEITQPPISTVTTEITQPPNSTMQVKDTKKSTHPPSSHKVVKSSHTTKDPPKRYLTRSVAEAPPLSKRLCKGDSLYQ